VANRWSNRHSAMICIISHIGRFTKRYSHSTSVNYTMYGVIEGGRCHRETWDLRYRALCGGPSWRLHVGRGHSQIAKVNAALFENRSPMNINPLTSLVVLQKRSSIFMGLGFALEATCCEISTMGPTELHFTKKNQKTKTYDS